MDIITLFNQARKAHQSGDPRRAEALYRGVLRVNPTHADAWYLLGAAVQALGKLDEAEEALRQALSLRPGRAEVHNHLGTVCAARGKIAEAASCFREALRLRPDFAEAQKNLEIAQRSQQVQDEATLASSQGVALKRQGHLALALASFERAVILNPTLAPAQKELGITLGKLGRIDEAVARLRTAIRLDPRYPEAHHALGVALHLQGKLRGFGQLSAGACTSAQERRNVQQPGGSLYQGG